MQYKKVISRIVGETSGLITVDEGFLLFNIARSLYNLEGAIVEIGSYKGASTICLAKGISMEDKTKVYAVDPHNLRFERLFGVGAFSKNTYKVFTDNIRRENQEKKIVKISKTSKKAIKKWNKPIKFLWIDGDHSYKEVMADFLLWEKFVVPGGVIAFHDTRDSIGIVPSTGAINKMHNGPRRLIEKVVKKSPRFSRVFFVDSTSFVEKIRNPSRFEAFRQNLVLIFSPFFIFYDLHWDFKFMLDRFFGNMGIFIRAIDPGLYLKLKKIKLRIFK